MKQSRLRRNSADTGRACASTHMILNGEGGSGKSWLIRHIVKDIHAVWGDRESVRRSRRVLLMAHHGAAAFNIKGTTICSALSIPAMKGNGYSRSYKSLDSTQSGLKTLRRLQNLYRNVQLVVIDEYSVVSCAMLRWIDLRLRELWPAHRDIPFGGRDVILAGDMGQLSPVSPSSLASALETLENENQRAGRLLWEGFEDVFTLRSQQRGSDDPLWYAALSRLRRMEDTDADRELFNTRFMAADDMPKWTSSALHITYKNADVDAANRSCIDRFDAPTFHFTAHHSVAPNQKEGDVSQPLSREQIESAIRLAEENASHDRVIPRTVDLAIGAPVTITQNLAQEAGLCNGTQATIFDFIQTTTSTLPVVLVRVEGKYLGPSFVTDTPNIVPIPAQSLSWLSNNKQLRVTRLGLPIRLAFAMTIHKVQGLTCSKLVFDTTAIPTSAFAYVGLSRIRHRLDIVLSNAFGMITSQHQQKIRATCQQEWMRLDSVEAKHESSTNILTEKMQTLANNLQRP